MTRAASWIRDHGGIAATRVFTRIWLALFGEWPWDELPVMPPELIYLPRWFPLNVYDWACWARQTIVPLTVVCSLRPVRPLPFSLAELDAGRQRCRRGSRRRGASEPGAQPDRWGAVFRGLDRVLHGYERHAGQLAPATAVRTAAYAPLRGVDHRPAGARRLLGRHPAAVGLLADGAAPARLRPRAPGHRSAAWPAWTGSRSGRTARTGRCAGWRPASRRSGTPCWR